RLDVRAQRTLEAAAVVGGHAEVGVLARVCRLTHAEFLTALDAARHAGGLVDTDAAAARFEHPLVREALLKRLGAARRAPQHRRVADAIEAFHADEVDRFSAELAHHLAATANLGGAPDAMAFAVTAGERAEAVCAYDEAAHWYAHALRLSHASGTDDDR